MSTGSDRRSDHLIDPFENSAGINDGFSICGGDFVKFNSDPSKLDKWYGLEGSFEEPMGREILQRLWQNYKNQCVNSERSHYSGIVNGTIHVVVGGGGSHLSEFTPINTSWRLYRDYEWGFVKLTAFNNNQGPYEEEDEDLGYVEPTESRAIVPPALAPYVKFDILREASLWLGVLLRESITTCICPFLSRNILDEDDQKIYKEDTKKLTDLRSPKIGKPMPENCHHLDDAYLLIVVNPINDIQCDAITTQSCKVTTNAPVPTVDEQKHDDESVDVERNSNQNKGEEKATEPMLKLILRTPILFPQSVVVTRSLVEKKEDLGASRIPGTIRSFNFTQSLCDLGTSINLMPFSIFKQLGLGDLKLTTMRLVMVDRTLMSRTLMESCLPRMLSHPNKITKKDTKQAPAASAESRDFEYKTLSASVGEMLPSRKIKRVVLYPEQWLTTTGMLELQGTDVLSPFWDALRADFIVHYEFDITIVKTRTQRHMRKQERNKNKEAEKKDCAESIQDE
ncbi:hypothetical protein FXO37_04513 [Capsicum annuum]|nr:hypothetical protein FXO37_04513 [Capsicum annuum]